MSARTSRRSLPALLLALLLALTGCAEIPMSSSVGVMPVPDELGEPVTQIDPDGPSPGAGPDEIVRGFLLAGVGAGNNFEVARSFLTGDAAEEWAPLAGVTVMPSGSDLADVEARVTSDQQELGLDVPVQGTVDAQGVYRSSEPGATSRMEFRLRQENGEWRISAAPNGIVLSLANFQSVFQSYSIYFFDPSFSYFVPEDRWIPNRASIATDVVQRLLQGPPEWLAGAVVSAIPEGLRLGSDAVTIQEGVATVSLDESAAALNDRGRALLRAQLEATLEQIATVSSVEIEVAGEELDANEQVTVERTVPIPQQPVVVSGQRLARLDGTRLASVPDSPELAQAAAPAVSLDNGFYAYLADDGQSLRRFSHEPEVQDTELAAGEDLIGPSIDRMDVVWTGERDNPGELLVVLPEGGTSTISVPFLQGRQVQRIRVSRDGSRLLVVSSDDEGDHLSVVGVNRNSSGMPVAVASSVPLELGERYQRIVDASWGSLGRIVVLGSQGSGQPHIWSSRIGDPPEDLGIVEDARTVTAAEDNRSIRVGTGDGTLVSHVSGSWQRLVDLTVWAPAYPG
ncbi:LpqB family beta-propeller domain-containing protein [Sediminivirga luteola]|uniref:Lipoprotein LpqB n=1 Tax=Sediminivirga luteola TaxID=1774748 RepID=A0A8J2TZ00_9MICO|nr:LpqB family beta-propeller domain-containing protein [Sediminivirga luteola]MCI2265615.1 LpqB family beta-propeller domain-containing protein [Sediminivirga luteola]GGA18363.1 lipoprotein LpqB [Sediminivirga luteola]